MRCITRQGYTLVEFLIYIAIVTGLLYAASAILFSVLNYKLKLQSIEEVSQSARLSLSRMYIAIQNATLVTSPVTGATSTRLELATASSSTNPTVFAVVNGILQIKEGSAATSSLTDSTEIVQAIFTNVSATGTRGTIRLDMTVSSTNATDPDIAYGMRYLTSVNLR